MIVNRVGTDETILPSGQNQPETGFCSIVFDETMGLDHGGVHHQLVLQAILQGGAISHP
jgi:hypothetical protein